MPAHRKIVVYVATSADGYIGRPDGGVEWLERPRPRGDYGMRAFLDSIDTILMGRKTYDFGRRVGGDRVFDPRLRHYVFSRRPPDAPPPKGVEFVSEPVGEFARRLRQEPGKDVWMMGGAEIIASFLDEGEIDRFLIHVIPVFIGEGIPLIAPRHRLVRLSLRSARTFPDGVVRLDYDVPRAGGKARRRGQRPRAKRSV
jgi:dihydrofolate reductase